MIVDGFDVSFRHTFKYCTLEHRMIPFLVESVLKLEKCHLAYFITKHFKLPSRISFQNQYQLTKVHIV